MKPTAANFKKLRLRAGLTQEQCARALGYGGKVVVCHKETRVREVTPRDILALKQLVDEARKAKARAKAKAKRVKL